jgi:hypothetical protein
MDIQNTSPDVAKRQNMQEINWLAIKAKVIGEYLVVSEPGN